MEQYVESPSILRAQIRELKALIKLQAVALHGLKRCRRTVHGVPVNKAELLKKYLGKEQGDEQAESWHLPHEIARRRQEVTVAHILYGELRGKPHGLREPERFGKKVEELRAILSP